MKEFYIHDKLYRVRMFFHNGALRVLTYVGNLVYPNFYNSKLDRWIEDNWLNEPF